MNTEKAQWFLLAILIVGFLGVGAVISKQNGKLLQVSRSITTIGAQLQDISTKQAALQSAQQTYQENAQPSPSGVPDAVLAQTPTVASKDPITFSTAGLAVHTTTKWTEGIPVDFSHQLTLENVKGGVEECGHALKSDQYYQSLIANLANAKSVSYTITANTPSQDPTWNIYVVQNVMGYRSLDAMKADLDVCAAGGIYPIAVDAKWMVFESSCGGASDSTLPAPLCGTIQEAVAPTVKLVD